MELLSGHKDRTAHCCNKECHTSQCYPKFRAEQRFCFFHGIFPFFYQLFLLSSFVLQEPTYTYKQLFSER
ncbi:hypothetical protein OBV_04780 [Oscillibacter valericigenes Sjm18-20]|nr:hypothetical protein OBV_04780 [Oscillibacter valericigenes Sjm18-20]